MATAAILKFFNIGYTPVYAYYHFCKVSSQKVQRILKYKIPIVFSMLMVTMATAAILKKVKIPKALSHGGYHFCEVSS
jgi:UDP-N-acetylglucosamine:LPS N-acetylglucosamine transferase